MKFSAGDTILIKKTGEEGRVMRYVDKETVEVELGNKRIHISVQEIDFPYLTWFTHQRKAAHQNAVTAGKMQGAFRVPEGIYLSFAPIFSFDGLDDIVAKLELDFINKTDDSLKVEYECKTKGDLLYAETIVLQPFETHHLHEIEFEKMNEQPRFFCSLTQLNNKKLQATAQATLKIKPKHLFEHLSKFRPENMPPFLLKVSADFSFSDPLPKTAKPKPSAFSSSLPSSGIKDRKAKIIREIDLHFEKLAPHATGLSNFEILTLQLNALEDALSQAIQAHQQSMIVIHGVGKGKLKEEIHALLRSYPEINFFQHEWSPRYGYGATEIFFN